MYLVVFLFGAIIPSLSYFFKNSTEPNYFNPNEAKQAENERAKKIRMELVAARLLSECMLTHLKDELDEKYKMPKACEKEIHALLNLNAQTFIEKQQAFEYMRR